jgi:hypothetical protein
MTKRCAVRGPAISVAARWMGALPIRASSFGFISAFVIRASSFPQVLAHHQFLVGAGISLLGAYQSAIMEIDQRVVH